MIAVVGGTLLPTVLDGLAALWGADGSVSCSGIVVAPDRVLTAGHCAGAGEVGLGPDGLVDRVPVVRATPHPELDLAVLELDGALPGRVWPLSDEVPEVGAVVSIAGFGATGDGADDAGRKRGGTTAVAQVDGGELVLFDPAVNACSGDSGGPVTTAVDGGVALVGVVRAVDPTCVGGRTRAIPPGAARDWLEVVAPEIAWGTWSPPSAPTGAEGCGGGGAAAVLGTVGLRWKRRTGPAVSRREQR